MSDGVYSRPGGVFIDGDQFLVVGRPAGPAGVSAVQLPDGSTWQVDHVDPSIPVVVEVDAVDPTTSPLMVAAFGGDGTLFLADQAAPMSDSALEEHRARSDRQRQHPRQTSPRRIGNDQAREAGRSVMLADFAGDGRLHPLARLAASLEFMVSFDLTAAGTALRLLVPELTARAEDLTDDVEDDQLVQLTPETSDELRNLCLRARKIGAGLDPTLRDLVQRLDHVWSDESPIAVNAMRMAKPLADLAEIDHLAAAPPPAPPQPGFQQMRRIDDALVEVSVARSDSERWVRVLHRNGLVTLGQAPLERSGLLDAAQVVVPADVIDEDLEIQVVDSDELAVLADRPADAIREAIDAGREAARSDRLGDRATAAWRWERCAELWDAAGDTERSGQATQLAAGPAAHPQRRSSVTDEITETLDA